ncbi:MAG: hypothetical protein QM680_04500 [Luteolibacter sp.]
MIEMLVILLRTAGTGLILLAFLHIPISRKLLWAEDAKKMSPVNASVFHVHTFFICLVLVMMGLPSLAAPHIFLERSAAGMWLCASFAAFWLIRLYFQWLVYHPSLWENKPIETAVHGCFTVIWTGLTALYAVCGLLQAGWLTPR